MVNIAKDNVRRDSLWDWHNYSSEVYLKTTFEYAQNPERVLLEQCLPSGGIYEEMYEVDEDEKYFLLTNMYNGNKFFFFVVILPKEAPEYWQNTHQIMLPDGKKDEHDPEDIRDLSDTIKEYLEHVKGYSNE